MPARYRILGLVFSLAAITYLDRLAISAAAPAISREFGFSPSQMGYVFSAFILAYALFEVPSGWLGDAIGTRKALTRIVLCWSAFTMLTGAAAGFISLVVIRFLFGAGEAGAFPMIARTVSQWFPSSEQGRAMSVAFLGLALGSAVSAPLMLPLIGMQGWRLPFFELGLLGCVWGAIWYSIFRDRPAPGPAQPGGVPWRQLLGNSNLAFICGMYFAYGYGIYFYVTWLPTYLLKGRGFSVAYTSIFSALPWVMAGAGYVMGGWATDRLLHKSLKWARCGVGAAGYVISALALLGAATTESRVAAALLLAAAAWAQMGTCSAAWAVCLDVAPNNAGVVTGFMNTVGNLGGAFAPLVVGYSLQYFGSWAIPFYVTAGIFGFGTLMWLLVDPREPVVPG